MWWSRWGRTCWPAPLTETGRVEPGGQTADSLPADVLETGVAHRRAGGDNTALPSAGQVPTEGPGVPTVLAWVHPYANFG